MSEASAEKTDEKAAEDKVADSEAAKAAKADGNEAYKAGDYEKAVKHYTKAIAGSSDDHTLFSNRSAAYASMEQYQPALDDALKLVEMRPDWGKGYARLGFAYYHLGRYEESKKAYTDGLKQEPENKALIDGLADVESGMRRKESSQAFRKRRTGIRGTLSKLVNPLGLSTKGAVIYAVCVISGIVAIVLFRAHQSKVASRGESGGEDADADL